MIPDPTITPPGPPPVPQIRDVIFEAHGALEMRARRLYALEPFAAEINRLTRGKRFTIHNDIVWTMALDSRDKLVIDLADWSRVAYAPGARGFLRTIQHHLPLLGARRTWGRDESLHDAEMHRQCRQRLFPGAGEQTSHHDLQGLIDRFAARFKPLALDRHGNRAHQYEHERSRKPVVVMHDFAQIRELVDYAHRVLLDLLLVACGTSTALSDRFAASGEQTARETVAMMMLPLTTRERITAAGVSFESFIDHLHEHDTSRPTTEIGDGRLPTFNDGAAIRDAVRRLSLPRLV